MASQLPSPSSILDKFHVAQGSMMPIPPSASPAYAWMLAVQQPTLQISSFQAHLLPPRCIVFLRNCPVQLAETALMLRVPVQARRDGLTTVHALDRDDTTTRQRKTLEGRFWQRGPNCRTCPNSYPISTPDREFGILMITDMGAIGSAAARATAVELGYSRLEHIPY